MVASHRKHDETWASDSIVSFDAKSDWLTSAQLISHDGPNRKYINNDDFSTGTSKILPRDSVARNDYFYYNTIYI